jgi:TRAP-type C4-dicarboxylate transport system permease small subunit
LCQRIARLWRVLERTALVVVVLAMLILSFTQIILRNFFRSGLSWAEPLLGFSLLWLAMIGALVATGEGRHITFDLAGHLLPPRWRRRLHIPLGLFSAVICGILASGGWRFFRMQSEMQGTLLLGLPNWSYYGIIPVCFGLMSWRFLTRVIATLLGWDQESPS